MTDTADAFPRRRFLVAAGRLAAAAGAAALLAPAAGTAGPAEMQAAIRAVVGTAPMRRGRILLDIPPLVENGNTVPVSVEVDSPMTEADHVRAIGLFNERNPLPHVLTAKLSPLSGAARIGARIRLSNTQRLVAVAALSDGTFRYGEALVVVTLAACVEG